MSKPKPIPMRLPCPKCGALHVDEGEFATKPHHAHACQACGEVWRPAVVYTVGVRFLPGFRNAEVATPSPAVKRETGSMWFYAGASEAEDWHGPHDSEADAIAEARADYAGERDDFWVDEALPVDWQKVFASFADADRVLEDLGDYIGDNEHVEDPEPEFATSKAEAQAALEAWFDAHVKMRPYYQCVGKPKGYLVSDPQPAPPDAHECTEEAAVRDALIALDTAGSFISAASDGGEYPNQVLAGLGIARRALTAVEIERDELSRQLDAVKFEIGDQNPPGAASVADEVIRMRTEREKALAKADDALRAWGEEQDAARGALAKVAEQSAWLTHLEAELTTARFDLSNGAEVYNAQLDHARGDLGRMRETLAEQKARIAELTELNARLVAERDRANGEARDVGRERDELKRDYGLQREYWSETERQLSTRTAELEAARELCTEAGCFDPGADCADRTLCMVEELRQRGVCTEQHTARDVALVRSAFASVRAALSLGESAESALHIAELTFGVDELPAPPRSEDE